MKKIYQFFVSSTYEDLKEERAKVIGVLLENNCIPVGMEQFPSSNLSQWEYITKMIDMSDYYILISAGKYGSIDAETGISYTEKEFDYAKKHNIPILSFIHKEPQKLPFDKNEENQERREKLQKFQEKAKQKLVNFYTNVDELATMVISSLNKIIADCPRPGWIRADKAEQYLQGSEYAKELKNVYNVLHKMQEFITKGMIDVTPHWGEFDTKKMREVAEQVVNENTVSDDEFNEWLDRVFPGRKNK